MAVKSKYKKIAYLGAVTPLLMLLCCIGALFLFIGSFSGEGFVHTSVALSLFFVILCASFGWLFTLTFRYYSRIIIDGHELKYYMPYLPFFVFYKDINDFEAKVRINTTNRYGDKIDGIWLITNGKLKYEIYSIAHANLQELWEAINLPPHTITDSIHPLILLLYQLRIRRVRF